MFFRLLRLNIEVPDSQFNSIYPEKIQKLAAKHWTPVAIARAVSTFLVEKPGVRVLDIGSGVGKFCLIGATITHGHFTGIEQRQDLHELSKRISTQHQIDNATFIHGNIINYDFQNFDAFYFFNSFYENIDTANRIDDTIGLDTKLYQKYTSNVCFKLSSTRIGTRLATYCSPLSTIPKSFKLIDALYDERLKFWEKVESG